MVLERVSKGPGLSALIARCTSIGEKIKWEHCPACLRKAKSQGRVLTDGDRWANLIVFKDGSKMCIHCANGTTPSPAPEPYRQTFENFTEDGFNGRAIWKAQEFAAGLGSLYLYGLPGRGKSHLLNAAYDSCRKMGKNVKKVIWNEFLEEVKAAFDGPANAEKELFDAIAEPEYLLIDDIRLNEDKPEFTLATLYAVLNRREDRNRLKIFITSNVDMDAWSMADMRISSRVLGFCGKDGIIELEGADHRLGQEAK